MKATTTEPTQASQRVGDVRAASQSHRGLADEAPELSAAACVASHSQAIVQRKLQQAADESPQGQRQARLQAMIDNSSELVAQRNRLERFFGHPAQPQSAQRQGLGKEGPRQGKSASLSRDIPQEHTLHEQANSNDGPGKLRELRLGRTAFGETALGSRTLEPELRSRPKLARCFVAPEASFAPGDDAAASAGAVELPGHNIGGVSAPIQRLTGYEVEANLPIYGSDSAVEKTLTNKGKKRWDPRIGAFLGGGLTYGATYGQDPDGHFEITADHNHLKEPHKELGEALLATGYVSDEYAVPDLTNIEYVTPPRDELEPGALALARQDGEAVAEHASVTNKLAQGTAVAAVPAPADGIATGMPVEELLNWVETGPDEMLIHSIIADLGNLIDGEVYLQETSGVLPEDLPILTLAAEKELRKQPGQNAAVHAALLKASRDVSAVAIAHAFKETGFVGAYKVHEGAVKGMAVLLASYLLADHLSQTDFVEGSVNKNTLPFLPKTEPSTALKALPAEVLPTTEKNDPWPRLVQGLLMGASKYDVGYWTKEFKLKQTGDKGDMFPQGRLAALEKLIALDKVDPGIAPGRLLGLDDPGPLLEHLKQRGIPLEDRALHDKLGRSLSAKNIGAAIGKRFELAHGRAASHVKESDVDWKNLPKISALDAALARLKVVAEPLATVWNKLVEAPKELEEYLREKTEAIRKTRQKAELLIQSAENLAKLIEPGDIKQAIEKAIAGIFLDKEDAEEELKFFREDWQDKEATLTRDNKVEDWKSEAKLALQISLESEGEIEDDNQRFERIGNLTKRLAKPVQRLQNRIKQSEGLKEPKEVDGLVEDSWKIVREIRRAVNTFAHEAEVRLKPDEKDFFQRLEPVLGRGLWMRAQVDPPKVADKNVRKEIEASLKMAEEARERFGKAYKERKNDPASSMLTSKLAAREQKMHSQKAYDLYEKAEKK